jgi:medium-chain acyl-[acyl-carrier-protein] hydrolase
MSQSSLIHTETFSVPAIECDFNREWKPSAILLHLTEIAGTHAALLGVGFDEMLTRNLFWIHSRMRLKFTGYPHAGEQVTVRTWPRTIYRRLLYLRDFEVLNEAGQRLVSATSAWVIVNTLTRRMAPPSSVKLNIPEVHIPIDQDEPLERLDQARDGEERLHMRAGYSAVDLVGHVNNSRYVEWICDSFPIEMFAQRKLDFLQINYEHEVLLGEEVSVLVNPVGKDDGLWAVEGRNLTKATSAFQALLRFK